ncbi:MAG: tRNA 2-thiouridine(34) synthase MnmA [Clostridiales bacterium]|nr:tRNA 2-thiouridine(34) synthase MnmA [Clostridiales bacterium]
MKNKKILIGMSGGVDSSVAAMLLRDMGCDVTGVTLILTPDGNTKGAEDAKNVADKLGIKHITYDMRDIFREKVIDSFVNDYISGVTPNPCITCNREIKFGAMLDLAKSLGCEKIATGHYAETEVKDGRCLLKRTNSLKDQSYFLSRLTNSQLACAVFPLNGYEKADTRRIADDNGLPVAFKKDSQEICFIPDNDYAYFIKKYKNIVPKEGNFISKSGEILGKHSGIINYTIGQRKGLGAFGKPMFVTSINAEDNTVTIGENGEQLGNGCICGDINSLLYDTLPPKFYADVKIRFRAQPARALITVDGDKVSCKFDTPQRSVTPGQTAVFYVGDYVAGSGKIISAF